MAPAMEMWNVHHRPGGPTSRDDRHPTLVFTRETFPLLTPQTKTLPAPLPRCLRPIKRRAAARPSTSKAGCQALPDLARPSSPNRLRSPYSAGSTARPALRSARRHPRPHPVAHPPVHHRQPQDPRALRADARAPADGAGDFPADGRAPEDDDVGAEGVVDGGEEGAHVGLHARPLGAQPLHDGEAHAHVDAPADERHDHEARDHLGRVEGGRVAGAPDPAPVPRHQPPVPQHEAEHQRVGGEEGGERRHVEDVGGLQEGRGAVGGRHDAARDVQEAAGPPVASRAHVERQQRRRRQRAEGARGPHEAGAAAAAPARQEARERGGEAAQARAAAGLDSRELQRAEDHREGEAAGAQDVDRVEERLAGAVAQRQRVERRQHVRRVLEDGREQVRRRHADDHHVGGRRAAQLREGGEHGRVAAHAEDGAAVKPLVPVPLTAGRPPLETALLFAAGLTSWKELGVQRSPV
ncbi:uncharacterized protein LOC144951010 [Lampetra fluviatilis]